MLLFADTSIDPDSPRATVLLGPQPSAPAATISFASVSAGGSHTCGLSTEGRTCCWGSNTFAQLGGGPSTLLESHFYPAVVAVDVAFMAVSAGGLHTCALDASGTAYCWGDNEYGQLGDGTATSSAVSVKVAFQP